MFDFRLDDDGQIQPADMGEPTQDFVMETCYPELDKAFTTAEWDETGTGYSIKGHDRIRGAVVLERTGFGSVSLPRKKLIRDQAARFRSEPELRACS